MSRNIRILLAVVVTVALAGAYWKLLLAPKREQATKLSASISKTETQLTAARVKLADYRRARGEYRANYAKLVRLGKAVPGDDDTRSLLVQLDAAAKRSGVDFRTVSVGGGSGAAAATPTDGTAAKSTTQPPPGAIAVDSTGFATMPFSFSFRGDFSRLNSFFARLQRFVTVHNSKMSVTGRLLRVESLDLKPDQLGFPSIRATVGANSYLLPAADGLTAGKAPSGSAAAGAAPSATPTPSGGSTPATTTATATGTNP